MTKIRTRFAPSPTGYLHVGGLRTALYNYLFAKHNGGDFLLRIEDTDRTRYVEGAIEKLIKILNLTGLDYDEGVILDKDGKIADKGNFGPYMQSKRLVIYRKFVEELIKNDYAYFCFCSQESLAEMRNRQQAQKMPLMYDGRCRKLEKDEVKELLDKKTSYVIRLKAPKEGFAEFEDAVYGKIRIASRTIDDQILIKSDGYPTYHLANVVDDHLMEISHVIRGEEWLPSTPKHILIYKAFGWTPPVFAHLPLLLNPDKSKLSKRQGDVSVESYLEKGYLKETLLNFILLLGWNPKTEEEIFSMDEMTKRFDLLGVNKYGAVFNVEKLDWLNGVYIRRMSTDKLTELCAPYLEKAGLMREDQKSKISAYGGSTKGGKNQNYNSKFKVIKTGEIVSFEWLKKVIALEKERMKKLSEIGELVKFVFEDKLEYDKELLIWKKMLPEDVKNNLEIAYREIEKINEAEFDRENIEKVLRGVMENKNIKAGELLWPLRVALTGLKASPGPFEVAEVLGKEKTLRRIKFAIGKIGQ